MQIHSSFESIVGARKGHSFFKRFNSYTGKSVTLPDAERCGSLIWKFRPQGAAIECIYLIIVYVLTGSLDKTSGQPDYLLSSPKFMGGSTAQPHHLRHRGNLHGPARAAAAAETTKRRRLRPPPPHGQRTRFDYRHTSKNVTVLKGQTAMLTCIVRNVGNRSVSYWGLWIGSSINLKVE